MKYGSWDVAEFSIETTFYCTYSVHVLSLQDIPDPPAPGGGEERKVPKNPIQF
ncbi:MAG: hypothetical protein WBB19_04875 [Desulforhopalus sp.]